MFKKFGVLLGASAMGFVAAATATPAYSQEVTVNGASCFPIGSPPSKPYERLVNEINKRGKGVVQVKMVGGAPAIGSPFTLVQKTARGAYDVAGCPEAYYGNVLSEVAVLRLAEKTFAELRKNGGIDYLGNLLAGKNVQFVGRHHDFGDFHLWLSKPITEPNLKGLHLRVAPVYTAFFKALGATVQQSNLGQIYTYMENNTVQGYGWPALGWVKPWIKVTKFRVEPGFYKAGLHTVFNKKKWDGLSKAQQKVISDVVLEFEAKSETSAPGFQAALKKQKAWMASEGMKTIEFNGADREKWVSTAKKAAWDEVLARSPKHGAALMKLFTN